MCVPWMVPASDLATDLASLSPVPLAEKDAGQACRGTAVGGRSRLYPVVLLSRALAADELPEREPTRFSERWALSACPKGTSLFKPRVIQVACLYATTCVSFSCF